MHKSHIPQCTILWQECAHVCTFLLQNDALWDIYLMHCGICEMGLLHCVSVGTELPCHLGHAYIISNTLHTLVALHWLLVPPRQCLFQGLKLRGAEGQNAPKLIPNAPRLLNLGAKFCYPIQPDICFEAEEIAPMTVTFAPWFRK